MLSYFLFSTLFTHRVNQVKNENYKNTADDYIARRTKQKALHATCSTSHSHITVPATLLLEHFVLLQ